MIFKKSIIQGTIRTSRNSESFLVPCCCRWCSWRVMRTVPKWCIKLCSMHRKRQRVIVVDSRVAVCEVCWGWLICKKGVNQEGPPSKRVTEVVLTLGLLKLVATPGELKIQIQKVGSWKATVARALVPYLPQMARGRHSHHAVLCTLQLLDQDLGCGRWQGWWGKVISRGWLRQLPTWLWGHSYSTLIFHQFFFWVAGRQVLLHRVFGVGIVSRFQEELNGAIAILSQKATKLWASRYGRLVVILGPKRWISEKHNKRKFLMWKIPIGRFSISKRVWFLEGGHFKKR